MKTIDFLRKPEVVSLIGKLMTMEMNSTAIGREIQQRFSLNKNITGRQVDTVYKDIFLKHKTELVKADQEVKDIIKKQVINTSTQLDKINSIVNDILDDPATRSGMKLAAIDRIMEQLKFQAKLLEKLTEQSGVTKVSKLEMTQIVVNSLDELKKLGYVIIPPNQNAPEMGIPTANAGSEPMPILNIEEVEDDKSEIEENSSNE